MVPTRTLSPASSRCKIVLRVRLDYRTFATLRRHAYQGFGGNRSAALRAILNASPAPVISVGRRTPPRRGDRFYEAAWED
jgi:hypothetical protein